MLGLLVGIPAPDASAEQPVAMITGVVLDENKGRVAKAEIEVIRPDGSSFTRRTDAKGRFEIEIPESTAGYRFRFSEGGVVVEESLEVGADQVGIFKITLVSEERRRTVDAYREGVAALEAGDLPRATETFENLLRGDHAHHGWLGLAETRLRQDEFSGAVQAAQSALDRGLDDLRPWRVHLEAAFELDDSTLLSEAMAQLIGSEVAGSSALRLHHRGLRAIADGDHGKAVRAFEISLELDPRQATAMSGLAVALFNHGDYERALEAAEQALQKQADDTDALTVRSRVLERQEAEAQRLLAAMSGRRSFSQMLDRSVMSISTAVASAPRAGSGESQTSQGPAIRLVPPSQRPATGHRSVHAIATRARVHHVTFLVDGVEVRTDDHAPFSASVNFDVGEPRRLVARAFDGEGQWIGEDQLWVNRDRRRFEVEIESLEVEVPGELRVTGWVRVPEDRLLESAALYANDEEMRPLANGPFSLRVPAPSTDQVIVRAEAVLDDGSFAEDAEILGISEGSEEIDVNLVELYAVVTDRDGTPIRGLGASEFSVEKDDIPQALERFEAADRVPLTLGLLIDSSSSMTPLMERTKSAAAQFLRSVLKDDVDRGFVVDFGSRPRLAQASTEDSATLLRSLNRVHPGGRTALYDAIVFALLHFEGSPGRQALVVLTDGEDRRSSFGPRSTARYAQLGSVPIYIISLRELSPRQPGPRGRQKTLSNGRIPDLEELAEASGGRIYYLRDMDQLDSTYRRIEAELRSQYFLAFATAKTLSDQELEGLEVSVPSRRYSKVRSVISDRHTYR